MERTEDETLEQGGRLTHNDESRRGLELKRSKNENRKRKSARKVAFRKAVLSNCSMLQ